MKRHIPNTLTCCNLICGCIGIIWVLAFGNLQYGLWMMLAACVFDFFDGFCARLLHVSNPVGKELDSLADCVSFGVLPAMMLFRVSSLQLGCTSGCMDDVAISDTIAGYAAFLLPMLSLLIPAFSALRLAKFNLDERQTSDFIGLPTPANALLWGGMIATYGNSLLDAPFNYMLVVMVPLTCWMLVAEIPMFSLKFHNTSWKDNRHRYVFIVGIILLFAVLQGQGIAWVIVWYIVWNAIYQIFGAGKTNTEN